MTIRILQFHQLSPLPPAPSVVASSSQPSKGTSETGKWQPEPCDVFVPSLLTVDAITLVCNHGVWKTCALSRQTSEILHVHSRPPQYSEYCHKASHMDLLVSQCI